MITHNPRAALALVERGSRAEVKLKSPVAYLIERELFVVQFQGLIVIDTAAEIEGLQAAVHGANLHDVLVSPILSSLRSLVPTTEDLSLTLPCLYPPTLL